jgi:hypothetical protein
MLLLSYSHSLSLDCWLMSSDYDDVFLSYSLISIPLPLLNRSKKILLSLLSFFSFACTSLFFCFLFFIFSQWCSSDFSLRQWYPTLLFFLCFHYTRMLLIFFPSNQTALIFLLLYIFIASKQNNSIFSSFFVPLCCYS